MFPSPSSDNFELPRVFVEASRFHREPDNVFRLVYASAANCSIV